MLRRPPRSTHCISSAASDVYKRQYQRRVHGSTQSTWGVWFRYCSENRRYLQYRREQVMPCESTLPQQPATEAYRLKQPKHKQHKPKRSAMGESAVHRSASIEWLIALFGRSPGQAQWSAGLQQKKEFTLSFRAETESGFKSSFSWKLINSSSSQRLSTSVSAQPSNSNGMPTTGTAALETGSNDF
eukprot:TRINITY_DN28790_c0_g1_i1.p1 TRINITY_DN28790_c0_g1~~TRINITY_DN28790_c0_g1_i1.p1  ORF type:complete len:186 (+),score=13.83 TRINITY_DN28790_c0_g1_i1:132-689(+)